MRIEVVQCGMCEHYDSEQYCEVWEQYIANDAFYCACGAKADRKTEPTISKMEQVDEPERNMAEDIVESFGFKAESYRQAKAKIEQTEREDE